MSKEKQGWVSLSVERYKGGYLTVIAYPNRVEVLHCTHSRTEPTNSHKDTNILLSTFRGEFSRERAAWDVERILATQGLVPRPNKREPGWRACLAEGEIE